MKDYQVLIIVFLCVFIYIIVLVVYLREEQRRINHSELPTSNPINSDCTVAQ
jgi:preprotein translocase subunit SecY